MATCVNDPDDDAIPDTDARQNNVGRIITAFTRSGGCSGRGFTGLPAADDDFIKLITSLPSAPRHPSGISGSNFGSRCNRLRFGASGMIARNNIVSYVFNQA